MADLITVDLYKELKGLASTKEDAKLEILVPSISQLVKTYCANSLIDFYSVDKIETLDMNWGTHIVQLTESPVISVSKVEMRDNYGASYQELSLVNKEYYINFDTDCIYRTTSTSYRDWPQGPGAVRITYRAGYAETPEDLKLAVVDLVTYYLRDEYKERKTLGSASVQNDPGSTMLNTAAFPDHIKRVLDLYKNY
jgi:hypothetical protein